MAKQRTNNKNPKNRTGVSLRQLKKELKLIPNDIKREMRFLDLLFADRNFVRTQAEREVLKQACYDQLKTKKAFDLGLLLPDELHALQSGPSQKEKPAYTIERQGLRTGTDG
jgi:hypothetical protein